MLDRQQIAKWNADPPRPDEIIRLLQIRNTDLDLNVPYDVAVRRLEEAFREKIHFGGFWTSEKIFRCSIKNGQIDVRYRFVDKGKDGESYSRRVIGKIRPTENGCRINLRVGSSHSWVEFVFHTVISGIFVITVGAGLLGLSGPLLWLFLMFAYPTFTALFVGCIKFLRLGHRIGALSNTRSLLGRIANGEPLH